jgi:hypothetical protein
LSRARVMGAAVIGGAAVLVGCGWIVGVAGDVTVVDVSDAASEATASEGGEAGAGNGADGETDGEAETGASASGFTQCGATPCAPAVRACCFRDAGATCVAGPSAGCDGTLAECDESGDCDEGVCCVARVAKTAGFQSRCAKACGPDETRTCSSAPECGLALCVPWACAGMTVRTCGGDGALTACAR